MSVYTDILKKHVMNLATELLVAAVIPAIEEAAKKTESPFDDVLLAALKEPLKAELLKLIQKIGE